MDLDNLSPDIRNLSKVTVGGHTAYEIPREAGGTAVYDVKTMRLSAYKDAQGNIFDASGNLVKAAQTTQAQ
jgi:hypothetical protein